MRKFGVGIEGIRDITYVYGSHVKVDSGVVVIYKSEVETKDSIVAAFPVASLKYVVDVESIKEPSSEKK